MKPNSKAAPEGGWGYLVCFGMISIQILIHGVFHCYGFILNDFLISTGAGTSIFPILNSCSHAATSIAGLFFRSFARKFSRRTIGIIGASFYCASGIIQVFMQSIVPLFVAYIFVGISLGLVSPVVYATLNSYFVKRRFMVMSIAQAIIGFGQMVVPMIIHQFMEIFGFRGCLQLLAALNFNCILAMLLMHPVEWHLNKVPKLAKAEEVLLKTPIENEEEISSSKTCVDNSNDRNSKPISKPKGKWETIVEFMDLSLFKDPIYVNIALGMAISFYSEISFFAFQPLYLFELNFTKAETAQILTIGSAADLASRCFLAIASVWLTINARYNFLAGVVIVAIFRCGFLFVSDFWSVAVTTAIIGFFKTWLHVPLPLIYADYLPPERFTTGFGLFLFLKGAVSFPTGLLLRYLSKVTHSYVIVIHYLNMLLVITALCWSIEILWVRYRTKRKCHASAS